MQTESKPRPLSYSRINAFTYTCPYAYYCRYVLGLRTERSSLNRVWGASLHKAIELWHAAGKATSLSEMMTAQLLADLKASWPDVYAYVDMQAVLVPEYTELCAELSKKYKAVASCNAYKNADVVRKLKDLENMAAAACEDSTLKYTSREGFLQRMLKHDDIARHYQTFDLTYPLLAIDDAPAIELDFTFDFGGHPCMARIDQLRLVEGKAAPIDLKSSVQALPDAVLGHNHQLTHYQVGMRANPDLPDPGKAAHYDLRTGVVVFKDELTDDLVEEWADQIRMVLAAEENAIFPRRRDDKCLQCDWFTDHCSKTTGALTRKET